jgi:putative endonuclease
MDHRSQLGAAGEDAAAAWYAARGYDVLARNWRCSAGELDLVVRRGDLVVICEVKTRRGSAFGAGFEAVGWRKQRKLRQLATVLLGHVPRVAVRFDVASVSVGPARPSVEVFEDAF